MKKYLIYAASGLALASCTNDSFFGTDTSQRTDTPEETAIAFGGETFRPTRAGTAIGGSEAAAKLNNNFIVYGFKYEGTEDESTAANDNKVFDLYNVNYEEGTAGTTESNTANWEYVGYEAHEGSSEKEQTIKYWDYSATGYVFSAVSGLGIKAEKTTTGSTVYDKGWTVTVPSGGDISTLYASDRLPITKPTSPDKYDKVTLTFRALGTKIRFAMYETVPGYSVHIDKFYYNKSSWENTETNFAINGTFKKANADKVTPLTVTYYDNASGIENRPKVGYDDADVTTGDYSIFGANMQATEALGTTSAEATYDDAEKAYTLILPYESQTLSTPADNVLELYVDYTLTSTGGSGEQIKVKHASAKVPTNFNQWKPNFAYTYIFKISDNTNGTTGNPGDPDDPTYTPTDPTGLFPITFDAVVISDEEDIQETITSVSDPSITTYQKGIVVTQNNEYVAGDDIYFENGAADVSTYKVYEVNNYGNEATTEEVVANWKKNFCVLTEVDVTYAPGDGAGNAANFIPLTNGTFIQKKANQAAKFTPAAGKTYVIANKAAGDGTQYKVVKIEGSASDPVYTQSMGTAAINTAATSAIFKLKSNSPKANTNVLGAAPLIKIFKGSEDVTTNFTITSGSAAGTYKITLTAAAIAAGANGTYTVKFNGNGDQTFTVGLSYALSPNVIYIVTAGTGSTFSLIDGTNAISKAVIKNLPAGVTIKETSTPGTYMATATKDAATGVHHVLVAGQDLAISVLSYSFSAPVLTITRQLSANATGTITLKENGTAKSGISLTTSPALASGTTVAESAGVYTYTVTKTSAGGTYNISYENAKAQVVVNAYTIDTPASIKKSTGAANIEVKCNGSTINAATASLVEQSIPAGAVYNVTTNGKVIRFSNASKAGDYTFTYKVKNSAGTNVAVARVTITVTE